MNIKIEDYQSINLNRVRQFQKDDALLIPMHPHVVVSLSLVYKGDVL